VTRLGRGPPLPPQRPQQSAAGPRCSPGTHGRRQRGTRRRRGRWRRCARAWRRGPRGAPPSARASPTASRPGSRRSRRLRQAGWRVACTDPPGSHRLGPGTTPVPCCTDAHPGTHMTVNAELDTAARGRARAMLENTNWLVRAASRTGKHELVQLCDLGFVRHAQAVQGAGAGRACKHPRSAQRHRVPVLRVPTILCRSSPALTALATVFACRELGCASKASSAQLRCSPLQPLPPQYQGNSDLALWNTSIRSFRQHRQHRGIWR